MPHYAAQHSEARGRPQWRCLALQPAHAAAFNTGPPRCARTLPRCGRMRALRQPWVGQSWPSADLSHCERDRKPCRRTPVRWALPVMTLCRLPCGAPTRTKALLSGQPRCPGERLPRAAAATESAVPSMRPRPLRPGRWRGVAVIDLQRVAACHRVVGEKRRTTSLRSPPPVHLLATVRS